MELSSTRWFEDLVTARAWDDDYEVVCPYACFGCRHAGPRSQLAAHLEACACVDIVEEEAPEVDEDAYVVVCPNAVMGCGVECKRAEIQAHLVVCPFSDVTRTREAAERTASVAEARALAAEE